MKVCLGISFYSELVYICVFICIYVRLHIFEIKVNMICIIDPCNWNDVVYEYSNWGVYLVDCVLVKVISALVDIVLLDGVKYDEVNGRALLVVFKSDWWNGRAFMIVFESEEICFALCAFFQNEFYTLLIFDSAGCRELFNFERNPSKFGNVLR